MAEDYNLRMFAPRYDVDAHNETASSVETESRLIRVHSTTGPRLAALGTAEWH